MLEMVVVLAIFFMLLGFGAVFYVNYSQGQNKQTLSDIEQADFAEVQKLVSSLPEIHCSFAGDEDLSCIDTLRAQTFGDLAFGEERLHYSELFHGYRADVSCVYNCPDAVTRTLFDYTGTGDNSIEYVVPVFLYEPINATTGYGLLTITYVSS